LFAMCQGSRLLSSQALVFSSVETPCAACPELKRPQKSWKTRSRSANEMHTYESRRNRRLLFQQVAIIATHAAQLLHKKLTSLRSLNR